MTGWRQNSEDTGLMLTKDDNKLPLLEREFWQWMLLAT
jgi:hypothetical protein